MMKYLFLFASFILIGSNTFAQDSTITGQVKGEDGLTIPGASVVVNGTANGVATDIDGNFSIRIANLKTAILKFSYLGYATQEIAVAGRQKINIVLKESAKKIDEVVVVGYGTSTKKTLTGATSQVGGEDVQKLNVARVDQALQGQVSGVAINTNSGSPGGGSSIRIRGLSTFGDNDPLILVDGVVYDSEGLNALNPNDIASVNVLKDATAGIYGVRAANGVIIIETKKGALNSAPQVEFSSYLGVQNTARRLDLLNATEYAVIKNEMFGSAGDAIPFNNTSIGEGTDWQDEVFQSALIQNYNFSVLGGNKNSTYSAGASYFTQDGIVGGDKSNFERINARLNLGNQLNDKVKLNSVILYTNEKRRALPENGIGSVLYNTINAFPNEPVKTADGNYSYLEEVSDIINPLAQIENSQNLAIVNKIVGKEELVFEINDNFTFTNRINYNYASVDFKSFSPLVWYGQGKAQNTALNDNLDPTRVEIADSVFIERGASVFESRSTYVDLNGESYLNYNRIFNEDHSVKGTIGVSVFQRSGSQLNGSAFNIPGNSVEYADISANLAPGGFLNNTGSFEFEERLLSTFFRGEYGFKGKYLASLIIRRDGSSKFGPNNRFGTFPTISAAWLISEEEFFDFKKITFAKLRASYGISGNDQIQNFAYRAQLDGEGVYVFDDVIVQGVAIGRASNPDLRWESTRQFNLGLDLVIGDNFNITTNYFIKNTKDLLFQPEVSAVLGTNGPGGQSPIVNAGDVSNKGIELELAYYSDRNKKLQYAINFNTTYLRNEVLKTPEGVEFIPGAAFGVGGGVATRFEEGFAIGYFHGFETDGIFQSQEEIDNATVIQEGAKPGDIRYVDQNGDGVISFNDDSDRKELGSAIPDFTFGLNLSASYRNFDFSMNIFSAVGQEIIRNYERQQPYANQLDYVIDRWVGAGTSDENPRLTTEANRNGEFSDYYVENGAFMRIKNMQIGYTLPKELIKKLKSKSIRIYVSVNNLLTVTQYRGFDPEIGSVGGALAAGVDYGFYPQARTVMGGFNFKF
ncbi:TonB-dependent receptor [Vicingaceae bacterium]|nr:TonB-dependent receptor [Vicingaceae bacterium]MDB9963589.1 TonB-dependent receptor [Vicingaceae bacterium]MDC1451340.1 TonB-dependent receptor [Vicingaceae bacterium]